MVDAQPIRDHIQNLRRQGMGYKAISEASGVAMSTIYSLVNGVPDRQGGRRPTETMRAYPARLLLKTRAVGPRVDPLGARRRLQALTAAGHTLVVLSAHTGIGLDQVGAICRGTTAYISRRHHDAICAAFDELATRPAPLSAGCGATSARRRAAAAGWAPAHAWDDNIDDPTAVPSGVRTEADDTPAVRLDVAEVIHLYEGGVTPDEIAARLGVEVDTVRQRLSETRRGKRHAA